MKTTPEERDAWLAQCERNDGQYSDHWAHRTHVLLLDLDAALALAKENGERAERWEREFKTEANISQELSKAVSALRERAEAAEARERELRTISDEYLVLRSDLERKDAALREIEIMASDHENARIERLAREAIAPASKPAFEEGEPAGIRKVLDNLGAPPDPGTCKHRGMQSDGSCSGCGMPSPYEPLMSAASPGPDECERGTIVRLMDIAARASISSDPEAWANGVNECCDLIRARDRDTRQQAIADCINELDPMANAAPFANVLRQLLKRSLARPNDGSGK